jgi:hypothetical protein
LSREHLVLSLHLLFKIIAEELHAASSSQNNYFAANPYMHRNSYNVIVKKSFRAIEVSGAGSHEEATPVDENHDRKQLATIDSFRNVDIEDEAVSMTSCCNSPSTVHSSFQLWSALVLKEGCNLRPPDIKSD